MEYKRYLVLENGQIMGGIGFGAEGDIIGEIVFSTGMTGYLETLTDPSYHGQIVVQTFPLIGNYGVIPQDFESAACQVKAYIVREWCQNPSNYRCEGTLDTFFQEQGIVGLSGVDTRELTKIIRERGVMNGAIVSSLEHLPQILERIRSYRIEQAVEAVSCKEVSVHRVESERYRVVLWDFGAKANMERELLKRGCTVIRVPSSATARQILSHRPDGVMLSNGPGNPADNPSIIQELKQLYPSGIPLFGVCLGHQLLALSQGGQTAKLKYGHRGLNQPVSDLIHNRVYITSQNHGYAVLSESLPPHAKVSFINTNDGTCEGVDYLNAPAFTVQFHPEAAAGPHDTSFLFDKFITLMKEGNKHAAEQ